MKIEVDLHTHTVSSMHHTKDTTRLLALTASERGLSYLGITDHSKGNFSGANESHFVTQKMLSPKVMYGVNLLYGAEVNILDGNGKVDLSDTVMKKIDYVIASLHSDVFKPSYESYNTNAIMRAMDNPLINIIGHPENSEFPVNFSLLADYAKETGTALELNSASVEYGGYRGDQRLLAKALLIECKKYGTFITLGSDSHGKDKVGSFRESIELLEEVSFPEDKILNLNVGNFLSFVYTKRTKKQ